MPFQPISASLVHVAPGSRLTLKGEAPLAKPTGLNEYEKRITAPAGYRFVIAHALDYIGGMTQTKTCNLQNNVISFVVIELLQTRKPSFNSI